MRMVMIMYVRVPCLVLVFLCMIGVQAPSLALTDASRSTYWQVTGEGDIRLMHEAYWSFVRCCLQW